MKATRFGAGEAVAVDIDEAAFWYELEFGAGKVSLDAVEHTRILDDPELYEPRRAEVRVAQVWGHLRKQDPARRGPKRKFPYGVYYSVDEDLSVYVWAVASLVRQPYYWLDRRRDRTP